jgi:hypothetical protein
MRDRIAIVGRREQVGMAAIDMIRAMIRERLSRPCPVAGRPQARVQWGPVAPGDAVAVSGRGLTRRA